MKRKIGARVVVDDADAAYSLAARSRPTKQTDLIGNAQARYLDGGLGGLFGAARRDEPRRREGGQDGDDRSEA
jgi:hypothetical protein